MIDRSFRKRSFGALARRTASVAVLGAAWLALAHPGHASSPTSRAAPAQHAIKAAPRSTFPSRAALPLGRKPADLAQPALLLRRGQPHMPDSLGAAVQPLELNLPVLVDEHGRAVLHELPWFAPSRLPAPIVSALLASLPDWHFRPAVRLGEARRVWAVVQYSYKP